MDHLDTQLRTWGETLIERRCLATGVLATFFHPWCCEPPSPSTPVRRYACHAPIPSSPLPRDDIVSTLYRRSSTYTLSTEASSPPCGSNSPPFDAAQAILLISHACVHRKNRPSVCNDYDQLEELGLFLITISTRVWHFLSRHLTR